MGTQEQENKEIVRNFYTALDTHDKDLHFDVLADEIETYDGEVFTSEEHWETFRDEYIAPFPDFSEHVEHIIAEDDMVAANWRFTGTHESGELLGVPPTGNEVEGTGNTLFRVEDGEITAVWSEFDRNAILQAIGVLPESIYEMKLHRQLLEVMFRVLRHNLRNELSTISGLAELIADEEVPAPAYAERIQNAADDLLATSEKARDLERSVVNVRRQEVVNVSEVIGTVLVEKRQEHPTAELTVALPGADVQITANKALLSVVLEEAIENAAVHADTSDPRIDVEVSQAGEGATVTVADNGPGIPDHELEPLDREREDPLTHGSGIGLWLIKWGVEQLDGEVEIVENEPRGTVVRLHFPADR